MTNPQQPNHQPSYSQPPGSKSRDKTIAIVVGAVALVLVLVVGGYFIAVKSGEAVGKGIVKEVTGGVSDQTNSSTTSSGDYSKVDPNALTVDQFYDDAVYPEAYRVRWANKIVRDRTTPAVLAQIDAIFTKSGRPSLASQTGVSLVAASKANTGNEILMQQTVAGYISSIEPNPELGRKLIASFISTENPGFEKSLAQRGAGQAPVLAVYQVAGTATGGVAQETAVFYQTAIGTYAPNGMPSKFMKISPKYATGDLKYSEITVRFFEGSWQTVNTIPESSPNWVMKPQDMRVS